MLQLSDRSKYQIPEYVDLATAIPGYPAMSAGDQLYYGDLYLLACYPKLLWTRGASKIDGNQLPENLADLQALVYFIFHFNLAYVSDAGKYTMISPFIPAQWSKDLGLTMNAYPSHGFARLLPELAPISAESSLYFSVLILSWALKRESDRTTQGYYLLYTLLISIMDNNYSQELCTSVRAKSAALDDAWLLDYLPTPPLPSFSSKGKQEGLKETLFGGSISFGLFEPPIVLRSVNETVDIPNSVLKSRRCLIL